jgi:D-alanyl-D-alanine carboxypeptidase
MNVADAQPARRAATAPTPPARNALIAQADMEAESQAEGDDDENVEHVAPPPRPAVTRVSAPVQAATPIDLIPHSIETVQAAKPLPLTRVAAVEPVALAPVAALPLHAPTPAAKPEVLAKDTPTGKIADPASLGWVKGPEGVVRTPEATPGVKPEALLKQAMTQATAHPVEETRVAKSEESRPVSRDGWKVQIAATDDADKANSMLNRAKAENRSTLALAKPFTEKVQKGDATLYRARFAVLDETAAESACRSLKRSGFSCFATRD